jgi:hypothetical protein
MAPAAQAEAIGSRGHAADRRELCVTVLLGYMKGQTSPKFGSVVGLTGIPIPARPKPCVDWPATQKQPGLASAEIG